MKQKKKKKNIGSGAISSHRELKTKSKTTIPRLSGGGGEAVKKVEGVPAGKTKRGLGGLEAPSRG